RYRRIHAPRAILRAPADTDSCRRWRFPEPRAREGRGMLDWVSENSGFVSASTGLVTAAIWLVYLQLFYLVYRGQRRAMIVITRALGTGSGGHCLVSNMSASPVHILSILAVLEADG